MIILAALSRKTAGIGNALGEASRLTAWRREPSRLRALLLESRRLPTTNDSTT